MKSKKVRPKSLPNILSVAEAIARLLRPLGEVVVHDLESQEIAAIFNSFSKRKAGDESLLEEGHDFDKGPDVLGPYSKVNWDGKKLKSITTVFRDQGGKARALLCMNLDVSVFDQYRKLITGFLGEEALQKQPPSLFQDDWREKINVYVDQHLSSLNKNLASLSKLEQSELVHRLHEHGAFQGKNAASYIGDVLGISRATVYNYLKESESHGE